MSNSYVIKWKSKVNGRVGKGSKVFPREEAERLADELNRKYPKIHHEAANAETPLGPMHPQPEAEQPDNRPSQRPAPKPTHALSIK